MLKTQVTEILKIEVPIIQGGMIWVAKARLAAAVSNAGGLGQIAVGDMRERGPTQLVEEIREIKRLTIKPFGINIPLVMPKVEEFIRVGIEEGVKIFITSAGNPALYTKKLKDQGIKVIHVVPSVRLAKKAEDSGVDIVVAEGDEAGGHNGFDDITTMCLIPQVVDAVRIPVVAAGGIADARGFIAALSLGAQGVQMGTRFVATHESIAHEKMKKAITEATDGSTLITGRRVGPVRVLKNKLSQKIIEWECSGIEGPQLLEKIGHDVAQDALERGDIENGSAMCGQIAGLIHDVISSQEVIDRILNGIKDVKTRLDKILSPSSLA